MRVLFLLLFTTALMAQERIITLTPSLSEIVAGLGQEKALVGVSAYASYPKSVTKLPQVGGYFAPSLERILSLRPTLVIGQDHHKAFLKQLKSHGIKALSLRLRSLDDIKSGIATIAKHLKVSGEKLIHDIDQALADARKLPRTSQKVLVTYGVIKDPKRDTIFISGRSTIFEDMLNACGAKNAFRGHFLGEPRLKFENLIALNPDHVIMLSSPLTDGTPDTKAIQAAWKDLPITASQKGRIHILNDNYLLIPSHRVALSIPTLCKVLHP